MCVGVGWQIFCRGGNPCQGAPTINSVSVSNTDPGQCSVTNPEFQVSVTISVAVPSGGKIQYRYRWEQTDLWGGSWTDWPGGFDSTSDSFLLVPSGYAPGSEIGTGGTDNGYMNVEIRYVGLDGTTPCGATDTGSWTGSNVDWCTA